MNEDEAPAPPRQPRVTWVGPKVTQVAPDASPEVPAEASAPRSPADNISRRLQWGFMVAIVIGAAFAFVGVVPGAQWVGFGGPLLAIVVYFAWGSRAGFAGRGDTRQRFADSCYFLGFLLTMIAMLVGFFPSGMFGWELRSQDILRHFSMALGATALGLIFRIVALQGGRSVEEDLGEAEAELRSYVAKVSTEAREIGAELENIRTHLAVHHLKLEDQLSQSIPAAIDETLATVRRTAAEISRGLEKQASSLQATAQSVAASLETRFNELSRIERETASEEAALKQSIAGMAGAVSSFSSTVRDMQERTRDAIEGATAEIARMGTAFGRTSGMTASLVSGMTAIEARVQSVDESIGRVDANVASATAASAGLVEKVGDMGAQLRADQDGAQATLRAEIAAAGERVAQVAGEAVDRFRQETEQSVEGTLREGRQQSEAMNLRASELESSFNAAVTRFAGVVDRFSSELAQIRAEGDQA